MKIRHFELLKQIRQLNLNSIAEAYEILGERLEWEYNGKDPKINDQWKMIFSKINYLNEKITQNSKTVKTMDEIRDKFQRIKTDTDKKLDINLTPKIIITPHREKENLGTCTQQKAGKNRYKYTIGITEGLCEPKCENVIVHEYAHVINRETIKLWDWASEGFAQGIAKLCPPSKLSLAVALMGQSSKLLSFEKDALKLASKYEELSQNKIEKHELGEAIFAVLENEIGNGIYPQLYKNFTPIDELICLSQFNSDLLQILK
jgi:hypothetical protein